MQLDAICIQWFIEMNFIEFDHFGIMCYFDCFVLLFFCSLHSSFFSLKSSEHLLYVSIYNEAIFAINKLFKIMMMRIFLCAFSKQPKLRKRKSVKEMKRNTGWHCVSRWSVIILCFMAEISNISIPTWYQNSSFFCIWSQKVFQCMNYTVDKKLLIYFLFHWLIN